MLTITSLAARSEHSWCEEDLMWMCPKCLKQISDERKICRECGAILEEVKDHGLAEASEAAEGTST